MCAGCRTKAKPAGMPWRVCARRLACVSIAARICISVLEHFPIFCPLCFSFVSLGLCLCGERAILSTHLGAEAQGTDWQSAVLRPDNYLHNCNNIFVASFPRIFQTQIHFSPTSFPEPLLTHCNCYWNVFYGLPTFFSPSFSLCRWRKWFMRVRRVCPHQEATFPLAT